ncbi:MAG: FAD-binding oxidoreductase [Rhodobacteraceae bacterium]|nr:FAD-binding oxidoreductase [Paracoccaceae bacterium]
MRRIFPDFAYGPGPRDGCWWDETIAAPDWPVLQGDIKADVGVIGGGFTGISAALHLAEAGANVAVLEAQTPGWGASGRNGGFCCLGGAALESSDMIRTFGTGQADEFQRAELDAVALAADLIDRLGLEVDRHSQGETQMAHNARAMSHLRREASKDASARLVEAADLAGAGMNGTFHGALTKPVGFGLNPRKYLFGIAQGAQTAGALLFQQSPVSAISHGRGFTLQTPQGRVTCKNLIIATNGYSSEDLPDWLAARYLPTQSAVLVTRPLSDGELNSQGWTSDQMAYDTRNLLHYFRLMPDRRFLFGMRGGLLSSRASEQRVHAAVRRDFEKMFPAWKAVESPYHWSGMVCISRARVPFVGPVPGHSGMFAGLAYHGNGVAMGGYSGRLLADLAMGRVPDLAYPTMMRQPPRRFPLGRFRRALMPPVYGWMGLRDL